MDEKIVFSGCNDQGTSYIELSSGRIVVLGKGPGYGVTCTSDYCVTYHTPNGLRMRTSNTHYDIEENY